MVHISPAIYAAVIAAVLTLSLAAPIPDRTQLDDRGGAAAKLIARGLFGSSSQSKSKSKSNSDDSRSPVEEPKLEPIREVDETSADSTSQVPRPSIQVPQQSKRTPEEHVAFLKANGVLPTRDAAPVATKQRQGRGKGGGNRGSYFSVLNRPSSSSS
jgi:hypothetical protein